MYKMKNLWKLILAFFILGVVADPKPEPEPDPGPELDLEAGDPEPDPQAEPEEDDPVALKAGRDAAIKEANEYKEAAERHRLEAESLRRAAPVKQGQSDDERLHESEEARLRDPKTTDLQRWQIESNRKLRANDRNAQATLAQAMDTNDRTSFQQLSVTKPDIYKRYSERVETELTKMRERGQAAPRAAILRFLIGEDALAGKFTKKPPAEPKKDGVDRGRSPGARSDVAARGSLTEHQKRTKRLENIPL
jgi:hypothetical protein